MSQLFHRTETTFAGTIHGLSISDGHARFRLAVPRSAGGIAIYRFQTANRDIVSDLQQATAGQLIGVVAVQPAASALGEPATVTTLRILGKPVGQQQGAG
jgi:hypothetical protein